MRLVKIACMILLLVRKCMEEALQAGILPLANYDLFVNTLFIRFAPISTKHFRIDDEVLPQLRVCLVVVGPWRKSNAVSGILRFGSRIKGLLTPLQRCHLRDSHRG